MVGRTISFLSVGTQTLPKLFQKQAMTKTPAAEGGIEKNQSEVLYKSVGQERA